MSCTTLRKAVVMEKEPSRYTSTWDPSHCAGSTKCFLYQDTFLGMEPWLLLEALL